MTPKEFQELRSSFDHLLELSPEERVRSLEDISSRDAAQGAELRREFPQTIADAIAGRQSSQRKYSVCGVVPGFFSRPDYS
jgi:hypothetical protein